MARTEPIITRSDRSLLRFAIVLAECHGHDGIVPSTALLIRVAPVLFVLLWSTGWIIVGFAMPFSDPFAFLSVRFGCAAILIGLFAAWQGASWPKTPQQWAHALISGMLLQGFYLAGVWCAVKNGLPAGISGVIAGVQPLLTAVLSSKLVNERVSPRQWLGVFVGLAGVLLVLWPKLTGAIVASGTGHSLVWPALVNLLGMVAATLGTFYQKRFLPHSDLRSQTSLQAMGGFIPVFLLALMTGGWAFEVRLETIGSLIWGVFGLSFAASGLMLLMIRKGDVSRVASLIYLMPPVVAIEAFVLLGERLVLIQIIGILITAFGVYLAVRKSQPVDP